MSRHRRARRGQDLRLERRPPKNHRLQNLAAPGCAIGRRVILVDARLAVTSAICPGVILLEAAVPLLDTAPRALAVGPGTGAARKFGVSSSPRNRVLHGGVRALKVQGEDVAAPGGPELCRIVLMSARLAVRLAVRPVLVLYSPWNLNKNLVFLISSWALYKQE